MKKKRHFSFWKPETTLTEIDTKLKIVSIDNVENEIDAQFISFVVNNYNIPGSSTF